MSTNSPTPLTLRAGDKCWVQTNKKHYGVCTGYVNGVPYFVHNTIKHGVVETDRRGFAGKRTIYIEQRTKPGFEAQVIQKARSYVGKRYDLLFFNCEHLANEVVTGQRQSKQLQAGVAMTAGFVAFGALLISAAGGGTYDPTVGRYRDSRGRFTKR